MPYVLLSGRWLLAGVLLAAGASKLSQTMRREVASAILDFGVIPQKLVRPAALLLPWIELVFGALLCAGIGLTITASLVAVMMGIFASAVG